MAPGQGQGQYAGEKKTRHVQLKEERRDRDYRKRPGRFMGKFGVFIFSGVHIFL